MNQKQYNERQCNAMLKIVADSWEKLRKCDVERLITTYGTRFAAFIIENRPDLTEECVDVCQSM
jgi:hypothetical protein